MSAPALAEELVLRPRAAFERFRAKDAALGDSAALYAAFLAGYALFYSFKPVDFPKVMEDSGLAPHGFFFWLGAGLFGSVLYAVWYGTLAAFLALASGGRLFTRLLAQLLWVGAAAGLLGLYAGGKLSGPLFALGWLAAAAPAAPLLRRGGLPLRQLLSLMLSVNLFALLSFPALAAAAWLRLEAAYMVLQFGFMFWMLGVATSGLRRLTGLSLPRCFLSLLLSFSTSILALYALKLAGIIPPELFRAAMAV